jgi:hypothetical protein
MTAYETAVLQEVKKRFGVDAEYLSRDTMAGIPFLDLREIGCIGTAFVFKTEDGWKVLDTPFALKEDRAEAA